MEFILKLKSDFLKALGHPSRLRIIEFLRKKEASVGSVGSALQIEQSVLSKHLLLLKQAGVLASRQEGTTVFYRLQSREIFEILDGVSRVLQSRLSETRRLLGELGIPRQKKGGSRGSTP